MKRAHADALLPLHALLPSEMIHDVLRRVGTDWCAARLLASVCTHFRVAALRLPAFADPAPPSPAYADDPAPVVSHKKTRWTVFACDRATGSLTMVQWLVARGALDVPILARQLAEQGHLAAMRYVHRVFGARMDIVNGSHAVLARNVSALGYILSHGGQCFESSVTIAAYNGDIAMLECLESHEVAPDVWAIAHGARNGQLAAVQWMYVRGYPCDSKLCANAARNGHLEIIQWARGQGVAWTKHTCEQAAVGGHVHVLAWARAHGCPMGKKTCTQAARRGHLPMLEWLYEHERATLERHAAACRTHAVWDETKAGRESGLAWLDRMFPPAAES